MKYPENRAARLFVGLGLLLFTTGCGGGHEHPHDHEHGHSHEDGEGHGEEGEGGDEGEDDEHEEVSIGTVKIGDLDVELSQGHGGVEAGKESHLVVKLPYDDDGFTEVRAWIGGEDRTMSFVGKAEYAADDDDYDIHATAPDPLPDGAMWWVEIEKSDGTKLLGSASPIFD